MRQATQASTPQPTSVQDDCNDPGQEHFDTTLSACGAAVANLINASPRTPTAEQITELIRATLREGFGTAPEEEEEEEAEAPIFGPVSVIVDPEDIGYRLQTFQFGVAILGKDEAGLRESIRGMLGEELAGRLGSNCIDRLVADLEVCEEKFSAMAHFADVAKKRLALAAMRMANLQYVPDGGLTQAVLQAGGHQ
jgi:hypothetical protein